MRPFVSILLSLGSMLHAAETAAPSLRKLPAISVLPNGSELKGVMIPRHDEQHRLVSSLKAQLITLVSEEIIAGEDVDIDFYREDGSPKGHINLAHAIVKASSGMLESTQPVTIDTDNFTARGQGLHYAFQSGQGFLVGPASSWIRSRNDTAMNTKTTSLLGAAALAIASPTTTASNEPSASDTPSEPVLVRTTKPVDPAAAQQITRQQLAEAKQASDAASTQTQNFIDSTSLDSKSLEPQAVPDAQPLAVAANAKDTVITCDGGIYFDADHGLLVYRKNVRVEDPRYQLTGADELKVFLTNTKKPNSEKSSDGPAKPGGVGRFNEVERIVATGIVRILQRDVEPSKVPVEASGAFFSYQVATGEILISGGYPWVKQGANFMRAKQPNLNLRIQKNGSFTTEGSWEMGGQLQQN